MMRQRFLAGAMWLAFLVCLPASKAEAHAKLVSSSPANGEGWSGSPANIRLVFSEKPVIALSKVVITVPDGRVFTLPLTADSVDAKVLIAHNPPLTAGKYSVTWRVVPADGHPVEGSFFFRVDYPDSAFSPVPEVPQTAVAPDELTFAGAAVVPAFLRGAAMSVLLALCGLLGFTAYSEDGESEKQKKLNRVLSISATLLLICHLIAWLVHVSWSPLDGKFVTTTLTSRIGADELIRVIFAALATWAVILAKRPKLAFAFALAAVIAGATMGHPAAMEPVIAIPIKAFHLVGVAFWMGGILWLITNENVSVEAASTVSSVAIVSISIVAITGLVETILFLNDLDDLMSDYGLIIQLKVAGLFVLAAFGARHRKMIKDQAVNGRFRASLKRETIIMIAVVMLAGLLAYVPTPVPR